MHGTITRRPSSLRPVEEPLEDLTIESPKHRPSEEMLAAARARANAPRSITSWVCGDPPPGMSALDKRNAAHS